MADFCNYKLNNYYNLMQPSFKSNDLKGMPKSIETVSNTIESSVDALVKSVGPDDNKKKKNRKRAIIAGSSVLVLGGITMLINPRNSSKIMSNMKKWQNKFDIKKKQNKDNFAKSKFYEICKDIAKFGEKCGNIVFNMNSGKDIIFQNLCINSNKKYPKFLQEKPGLQKVVKFFDDIWVKIFNKPHKYITKKFDGISQATVKNNYKFAAKKMNALEEALKLKREQIPLDKRHLIDAKLAEITKAREVFSETNLVNRFDEQVKLMTNLEEELWKQIKHKKEGYIKNSTNFWVEDILKTQKAQVEKQGCEYVDKLIGTKNKKGLYDEVIDIYRQHLSKEELKGIEDDFAKAGKRLRKANRSECTEYFDKKRDLIIGSAPTDIVTVLVGLTGCGYAVAKADKENRAARAFTTGVPVVVGLATSLACTAMLYSGGVGLIIGGVVGGITSVVCSLINKYVFNNEPKEDVAKVKNKEAKNV